MYIHKCPPVYKTPILDDQRALHSMARRKTIPFRSGHMFPRFGGSKRFLRGIEIWVSNLQICSRQFGSDWEESPKFLGRSTIWTYMEDFRCSWRSSQFLPSSIILGSIRCRRRLEDPIFHKTFLCKYVKSSVQLRWIAFDVMTLESADFKYLLFKRDILCAVLLLQFLHGNIVNVLFPPVHVPHVCSCQTTPSRSLGRAL